MHDLYLTCAQVFPLIIRSTDVECSPYDRAICELLSPSAARCLMVGISCSVSFAVTDLLPLRWADIFARDAALCFIPWCAKEIAWRSSKESFLPLAAIAWLVVLSLFPGWFNSKKSNQYCSRSRSFEGSSTTSSMRISNACSPSAFQASWRGAI